MDDDLDENYELMISKDTFVPFTAIDEDDNIVGHEAVGFRSIEKTETYKVTIGEWECIEMELPLV